MAVTTPSLNVGAILNAPDEVRYFDPLGACKGTWKKVCAKPATGVLRGPRNESYGPYCRACADKRLASAKRERAAFDLATKSGPTP